MCMGPPTTHHKSQIAIWVYPHVYGATYYTSQKSNSDLGLSPCVWGHPPSIAILPSSPGSIPMCMGPPLSRPAHAVRYRVYPLVYGATLHSLIHAQAVPGLSPSVRGHLLVLPPMPSQKGSIPMCMGPPTTRLSILSPCRVYPHVYGATKSTSHMNAFVGGLSPCVWGHPVKENEAKSIRGSIPMCMGPPTTHHKSQIAIWVYPHVYGATYYTSQKSNSDLGLSPCVWGHLLHITKVKYRLGSIPMCMGPPTFYSYFAFIAWVYPHVYGATRVLVLTHRTELGLSPCVWGHLPLPRSSRMI